MVSWGPRTSGPDVVVPARQSSGGSILMSILQDVGGNSP